MNQRIPLYLLTGFLGAGKTTLLNQLVQLPDFARTLVIINEFGSTPLDHKLVTRSNEEQIVELSSGCICCTIRGDLAKTLSDAHWRFSRDNQRMFDRVIIETTGLADPSDCALKAVQIKEIWRFNDSAKDRRWVGETGGFDNYPIKHPFIVAGKTPMRITESFG